MIGRSELRCCRETAAKIPGRPRSPRQISFVARKRAQAVDKGRLNPERPITVSAQFSDSLPPLRNLPPHLQNLLRCRTLRPCPYIRVQVPYRLQAQSLFPPK